MGRSRNERASERERERKKDRERIEGWIRVVGMEKREIIM